MTNFGVNIMALQYKKWKLFNSYLFLILRLLPFTMLKFIFNSLTVNYIYKLDDLYLANYGDFRITPLLISVIVYKNDEGNNITDKIKKYNHTVPFWYFIINEKLTKFEKIQFKYFSKGKLENKTYQIDELENKLLYDIF